MNNKDNNLMGDILNKGLETETVPFEESAMGKIHMELKNQTNEAREYRAQEERHHAEDRQEADRDQAKLFKQQIFLSVFSAIIGAIITNIDRIWRGISALIQQLF